jgi:hypothetical protein
VDEPWIAVISDDHRLVFREQGIEIIVAEAVRMLCLRLQGHQINNIDDTDLEVRHMLEQEIDGSKCLERRHVARAGHDHIGLATAIVACPFPYADAVRAMLDRSVHVEPLRLRLLARDDDIYPAP